MRGLALCGSLVLAGCGSESDDEYRYDAEDMRVAVIGTWSGSYHGDGTGLEPLSLTISEPEGALNRLTCSNRTFAEPGAPGLRCVSTSSLAVAATLTVEGASLTDIALEGEFFVPSLELTYGYLSLSGANTNYGITAEWSQGAWTTANLTRDSAQVAALQLESRE